MSDTIARPSDETERALIAVIDDTPISLRSLIAMVEGVGHQAVGTDDPTAAVELIRNTEPDLILLDIDMPMIDGYEICHLIKQEEALKEIPVIFISALINTDEKVEAFQRGGVDYITKPFAQEEVLARVQAHLSIKRSKDKMRRINRNLRLIFSVISHDLRNPFVGLLSFPEFVTSNMELTKDELQDLAQCSLDQAKSTLQMLDEMLDWARAQGEAIDTSLESINLWELADKVEEQALMWAQAKGIQIKNMIPEGQTALADQKILSTVLRNLLSNGIKFTPEGGTIEITTETTSTEGETTLSVKDSGIGIGDEQIQMILKAQKVISDSGTNNEQGSGIGLMLSQMLLQDMGSWLSISSKQGEGAKFSVHLKS